MTPEEEERVRRNYASLAKIETLVLEDAIRVLEGGEGSVTDTARGQLIKFLESNGFNADLTTIPTLQTIQTDLTPDDLAKTGEPEW